MKKVIASLTVCCLLFGSLTLGSLTLGAGTLSLTLSSCSSKNNPANRGVINSNAHATSDPVAKKTVAEKEVAEKKATVATEVAEKKAESTKYLAWLKSPFVTSFAARVVSGLVTTYVFPMPKVREKIGKYEEKATRVMSYGSLVVAARNMYYAYSNYGSLWSGVWQSAAGDLAGICVSKAVHVVVKFVKQLK